MKLKLARPQLTAHQGEDDILNLGVDAAGLERAIQTVKNQLKELTGGLEEMIQVSVRSTKQGVKVTAQLTEQRNAGQKLKTTLEGVVSETGKFDQGLKLISGSLTDTTTKIEKQTAAQAELKRALEQQIIREERLAFRQRERIKNTQAIIQSQLSAARQQAVAGVPGATGQPNAEQARALGNALGRLAELQERFNLRSSAVLSIFRRVRAGGIEAYTGVQRQVANTAAEILRINNSIGEGSRRAFNQLKDSIRRSKLKEVKRDFAEADRAAKAADAKVKAFARTIERVRRQKIADVKNEFGKVGTAANAAGKKGKDAANELTVSWRSFGRLVAVNVVSRAFGGLLNAFTESIDSAKQFTISIAEIRTISRTAQLTTEAWSQGVRELSEAFGLNAQDVAEGTYQILSNQVAEGAEAFKFQREAAIFARAAVASNADAVNLLTSAINAFGLESSEVNNVADIFFKTIELGRLRAADLANTFGRVGNLANQLGVGLEEVTAGIATITIQGVRADEAITGLRNIFLKIIRPTDEMKELFKELGVESGKAAIETFGFSGFLKQLSIIAERDGVDKIGKLFGRIRAITAALQLGGTQSDRFAKSLTEISDSAGAAARAAQEVLTSIGGRFEIELEKIKNFFTVSIGKNLLEGILKVTDAAGGLARIVKAAAAAIGITTAAIVLARIVTIGWTIAQIALGNATLVTTTRFAALNLVVKANPFFFIVSTIGLAIAAFAALSSATQDFTDLTQAELPKTQARFSEMFIELERRSKVTTEGLKRDLKERFQADLQFIAELRSRNSAQIEATESVIKETTKRLKIFTKDITKAFRDEIREVERVSRNAERDAARASANIAKITSQSITDAFELSLEGLSSGEFANTLRKRIEDLSKLITKASKGAQFVNFDRKQFDANVKEVQKRIDQLNKQRIQSQDQIRRNETAEVKLLERQDDIQRRFVRRAEDLLRKLKEVRFDTEKRADVERKLGRLLQDRDRALGKIRTRLKANREETKELRKANIDIAEIGRRLAALAKRRLDVENQIVATKDKQKAQAAAEAEDLETSLKTFRETFRTLLEFDPEKAIEQGLDKASTALDDNVKKTLATLSKLDPAERARIEIEIEKQRIALLARLRQADNQIQLNEAQETAKKQQEIVQQNVNDLIRAREEAAKKLKEIRLKTLNEGLTEFKKTGDLARRINERQAKRVEKILEDSILGGEKKIREAIERAQKLLGEQTAIVESTVGGTRPRIIATQNRRETKALLEIFANLNTNTRAVAADIKSLDERLVTIKDAVGAIDTPMKTIADSFEEAADAAVILEDAVTKIEKLTGKIFSPSINFDGKQAGGLVRGSGVGDRVPTLLEPGEFVINKRSTRDFFSQLQAINSGQVQGRQNGGVVNNMGDVNVTLESVSQDVDARSIALAVKQQLSRGSVRFRQP